MDAARMYWSPRARMLQPYTAGEQPRNGTFIKLNTNENPYPPSPRVAQAIQSALASLPLYPDADSRALCGAIAGHHGVDAEQVFAGNGSDEVLAFAFLAFFSGGTLIAPDITYSFYPVYSGLFDVDYRTVAVDSSFALDIPGLKQGHPIILANPNAPTSREASLAGIEALAAHCLASEKVLLIDEAYADFGSVSCVPLVSRYPNVLVVRTFSKSYALAGARIGYALGQEHLIQALRCVKDSFNSYPLDCLAQAAGQAAIEDAAYHADTCRRICRTRNDFADGLRALGFSVLPSATNFVFASHPTHDAAALQIALREKGVLVRHFSAPRIQQYLRISIGTDGQMAQVLDLFRGLVSAH